MTASPCSPAFSDLRPVPRAMGRSQGGWASASGLPVPAFDTQRPRALLSALLLTDRHGCTHTLGEKKKSMRFEFLSPSWVFGKLLWRAIDLLLRCDF